MYRLLIVDDEHLIVDGLYELFQELDGLELHVHRAYSGEEALKLLDYLKVDIVLTDIRMPGISGLELQSAVRQRWTHCKFIFLTGYSDFDLIQQAVRDGAINYILKTEDDEEIIAAVKQAVDQINKEITDIRFIEESKRQLRIALPVLRSKYLREISQGSRTARSLTPEVFDDMEVKPDFSNPFIAVIGRVDHWRDELSQTDRLLLLSAIDNIGEECFRPFVCLKASLNDDEFLWLLQPRHDKDDADIPPHIDRYAYGILESVQQIISELLKLTVSFALSSRLIHVDQLAYICFNLKRPLIRGLNHEMLLTVDSTEHGVDHEERFQSEQKLRQLYEKLILNEKGLCLEVTEHNCGVIDEIQQRMTTSSLDPAVCSELFFGLVAKIFSQINLWGGETKSILLDRLSGVLRGESADTPITALDELKQFLIMWSDFRRADRTAAGHRIVAFVNQYIENHLDQELSLTVLSEHSSLNATYLSRIYKTSTGVNLIQYINEKRISRAKELLGQTLMKVTDIAAQVGFQSSAYFSRLFRRAVGMTPQEYREHARSQK